jgi:hypothetical protein
MKKETNSITFSPQPRAQQTAGFITSPWGLLVKGTADKWYNRQGDAFSVAFDIVNEDVGYAGQVTVTRL